MSRKLLSIVIPCLNEEKVIGNVIRQCKEGLSINKIDGQILIMDSGSDGSSEIAKGLGAEVIKIPKSGLGAAYKASLKYIKGKYILMGDADGTYDFMEMNKFVEKLYEGCEYVMGTRLKGWIDKGAMPGLHRYFGTPVTTWILNKLFNLNFSDIHCGLRALTYDAFRRMDLKSNSWEYASEMVVKAGLLKLISTEVPIHFYKDKKGRVSHHKRLGWFSPWYAGWLNLKIMLLYAPNFVFYIPGFAALISGVVINTLSLLGLFSVFKYHFALLGIILTIIGYLIIQFGVLSKIFGDLHKYYEDTLTKFVKKYFSYNTGMIAGFSLISVGLLFDMFLLSNWVVNNFELQSISIYGVFGLTLMVLGFQTIFFSLIYEVFSLSKL